MPGDLIAFLNARIDEDDRYLKSNQHHLWTQRPLREVEAKRTIVATLEEDLRLGARTDLTRGGQIALFVTCKRLAVIYGDHPDYRQEWKP